MTQRSRGMAALNPLFNLLAVLFVLFSCLSVVGVMAAIVVLPPQDDGLPTPVAALIIPTMPEKPSATDAPPGVPTFPPTWTPTTPTLTPTRPTSTPSEEPPTLDPLDTRTPTFTPTPTETPTKTYTPGPPTSTRSALPYTLQNGSPAYLRNYVNTAACQWMGIVGQAFGLDGKPQLNLYVHLEGGGLNVDGVTGSQPAIGPGAYQIVLSDHPIATTDTYRVVLRNASGQAISDTFVIPTKGECNANLILVNFAQNH